jgi:hypothetical protein
LHGGAAPPCILTAERTDAVIYLEALAVHLPIALGVTLLSFMLVYIAPATR